MCGIVAIFGYNNASPPIDREELLKIREAMTNRGPDGAGAWISDDNRIGMAHRRLAIIDLSDNGAQPMADKTGQYQIVFNGEIYNYRELRSILEKKGYQFRSTSDTEVLLNLYAEKGMQMVHDLRGMYAFALWDNKRKGLFLARDPFGIKPLYYADNGHTIRIASQVKALLKGGGIDTAHESAGQVGFFLWGFVPEPYTLYKNICALPAGSTLWIDAAGKKNISTFCEIANPLVTIPDSKPQINRNEELRDILLDSLKCHIVADVPVGIFLSSGKDSTTIAALVSEFAQQKLHTVTLGFNEFKGTKDDEVPLAEKVASQYNTIHRTEWISKNEFHQDYEDIINSMDQPSIDGINTYYVCKAAARTGLKVALSGLGADELFGGYPSFSEIPKLVGALKGFSYIPWVGALFRNVSAPFFAALTSPKYAGTFEYGSNFGGAYLLRRSLFMPWELSAFIDPAIVKDGLETLQTIPVLNGISNRVKEPRQKVSALEVSWYMRNQLLRDSDWAGMAHSLEVRVPLVDIEFFKKIKQLETNKFVTKGEFVGTPLKALPVEVLKRPKTGFCIPTQKWIGDPLGRGLRGWAQKVYNAFMQIDNKN
jgi:asparagine synthase (glutamine-hydrolysing)